MGTKHEGAPGFNDQRVSQEPYAGNDRRGQPDLLQTLIHAHRMARRLGSVLGAIAVIIGLGVTWGVFNNPFEMVAKANETRGRVTALESRAERVDTNTAKGLRIQLKGVIRETVANLEELPKNSPARRQLETTLDQTEADLRDVETQLGVRGQP